jgi:NitT/TauT family transport system substrate-binding protein
VPFPQMEDALRQQRVDAAFMVAPFSIVASQKGGLTKVGNPYSQVQPGVDVGQYIATGKLVAAKPETIRKFVTGLRRGIEWYNANLTNPVLLTLISGYTRADVSLLKMAPLPTAPLRSDLAQVRKTMDLMIENKLLPAPLDLAKIIDPLAL